jgi:predicted N-acetyltransferase YhbS
MIRIRSSSPIDSAALIRLTSLTPMSGNITIRTDREPDFFALLRERGNDFLSLVAEDDRLGIIGSFTATREDFLLDSHPTEVYYLADLKIHPAFTGSTSAYRLAAAMHQALRERGADLLLCTAVRGNQKVMPFFDGRAGIPSFCRTGDFYVNQLLPSRTKAVYDPRDGDEQQERLRPFYSKWYDRFCFHPATDHLGDCTHFINEEDGVVKAAISLTDPSKYKQNILLGYPALTGMALAALKTLGRFLPFPALPSRGDALRIAYVRYIGAMDNDSARIHALLNQVRRWAYDKDYHFISVTAHEKDKWMNEVVRPFRKFVFISHGLVTSLKGHTEIVERICRGMIHEDYSLI